MGTSRSATGLLDLDFGRGTVVRGDARLKRVRHGDMSVTIEPNNDVGLLVNLSGAHRVEGRVDGRSYSNVPRSGTVTVFSPDCRSLIRTTGRCSVLMLGIRWQDVRKAASRCGMDPDRVAIRSRVNEDDPALARLMFAIADAPGEFEGDRTDLVAEHLVFATLPAARRRVSGGLSGPALRRVVALCRETDPGVTTLAHLADEAGLSLFHFAHGFKQATGLSPHAFVVRCRTDRALDLIARTTRSVASIARESGFANASHMSMHVRRATGFSPERWRRVVLP